MSSSKWGFVDYISKNPAREAMTISNYNEEFAVPQTLAFYISQIDNRNDKTTNKRGRPRKYKNVNGDSLDHVKRKLGRTKKHALIKLVTKN